MYFCWLTAMPQYPSFLKPILPVPLLPAETLSDAGRASERGVSRNSMLKLAPLTGK